jgi:predicted RNA binding protein YcfA (HicA-like mRNA interferase family)
VTKLPELKSPKITRALERLGFEKVRQSGSHAIYKHGDGRWTIIPVHPGKSIDPDLLSDILKQIKITKEEFLTAIRKRR